jgi:predicted acylesterase/phospholipase RssA
MNTLLLSSGGIKGYSFLGVWKYLEEIDKTKDIQIFSGVSIGAFFNLWFVLGYTYEECYKLLMKTNIFDLFRFDFANFFESYGMIDVEELTQFMIKQIELKQFHKDITFQELYDKTGKELHTFTFCVDDQKLYRFDKESTPNCPIRIATLMSMSIPLIFHPIEYNGKLYVDGAVKNGFPIKDYDLQKTYPCVIMNEEIKEINNIFQYTFKIVKSLLKPNVIEYACCIYPSIGTLDITIKEEEIDKLIYQGYQEFIRWLTDDLS